jgi:hypothetical protein
MNGNGNGNGEGKGKGKRKYYVGEDGVGIWRPNMEVGNFVSDGVGTSPLACGHGGLIGSDGRRTRCSVVESYPTWPTRHRSHRTSIDDYRTSLEYTESKGDVDRDGI